MDPGIFISYRRRDSQHSAGRLAADLRRELPSVRVFRDVETIEPGLDFLDAINKALASSSVVLVLIGPTWGTAVDSEGRRRLENPDDPMRLEIETALRDETVRVIPVLLDDAKLPSEQNLPGDMKRLLRRQAFDLSDKRWTHDIERLINAVRNTLDLEPHPVSPESVPTRSRSVGPRVLAAGIFGLVAAGIALIVTLSRDGSVRFDDAPEPPVHEGRSPENPAANKVDGSQEPVSGTPKPETAEPKLNLAGSWVDPVGDQVTIRHAGPTVHLLDPEAGMGIVGTIRGETVEFDGTINFPTPEPLMFEYGPTLPCRYEGNISLTGEGKLIGTLKFTTSVYVPDTGDLLSFEYPVNLRRVN